jgi:tetratricopeptide (TPR) repeat protein
MLDMTWIRSTAVTVCWLLGGLTGACATSRSAPTAVGPDQVSPQWPLKPPIFAADRTSEVGNSLTAVELDAARVTTLTRSAARNLDLAREALDADSAALLERARVELREAMELNPELAATINLLALRQLEVARRAGGVSPTPLLITSRRAAPVASQQGLELARNILSLGLVRFPENAELQNTAGLIEVELHEYDGALRHFAEARRLATEFEAAHYNYAALAFELRDYAAAQSGYAEVLRIAPTRYEAKLGLALSIALALETSSSETEVNQVFELLRDAKRLDPERPEAYFNAALFLSTVLARRSTDLRQVLRYVDDSVCLFEQFMKRAHPSNHAVEIEIARARTSELTDLPKFVRDGPAALRDCTRTIL